MSVSHWIVLATEASVKEAEERSGYGEIWFHASPEDSILIDFGDGRDAFPDGTLTYEHLKKINGGSVAEDLAILEKCFPYSSGEEADLEQIKHICAGRPELRIWFHGE